MAIVFDVSESIRNTVKNIAIESPVPSERGGLKNMTDETAKSGTETISQGLRRPQRVRVWSER